MMKVIVNKRLRKIFGEFSAWMSHKVDLGYREMFAAFFEHSKRS